MRGNLKPQRKYVALNSQDARILQHGQDAFSLQFLPGQRVRITVGSLAGVEGIMASQRSAGKVLVSVKEGVYIEMDQSSLEMRK